MKEGRAPVTEVEVQEKLLEVLDGLQLTDTARTDSNRTQV